MPNLKLTLSEHSSASRFRLLFAAFLLTVVALIPVYSMANPAEADAARRVVLGKANMKFEPNCGKNFSRDCLAEGRFSGFQSLSKRVAGRNFFVPFEGKIVSWSIKLANPTRKDITKGVDIDGEPIVHRAQMPFFNSYFGAPAQARIGVLKQVEKDKKGPPRYKMVRQSPVEILNPYFGTTVQFALSEPLNVIKNQVIALTVPTWAPAIWRPAVCNDSVFASPECEQAEKDYTWRGSRAPDKCSLQAEGDTQAEVEAKVAASHPQQKVNSVKRYGCYYGANVLLYSATIIEKP